MIATLLLTGLLLANPDAKISYKKKVMVDPSYKPARTAVQIERALAPPPPRPQPRVVYKTVVRTERRRYRWLPRISIGLAYGRGYHHRRHHRWGYGIGLSWPWLCR